MKFTNIEAFNSLLVLQNATEQGKLGFAIAKNRRKLLDELKEYISARDEIIQKYGIRRKDGGYDIPDDSLEEYNKELAEIDNIEFDVAIMPVDESTFLSGTLTSQQMFILDWMLENETKEGI